MARLKWTSGMVAGRSAHRLPKDRRSLEVNAHHERRRDDRPSADALRHGRAGHANDRSADRAAGLSPLSNGATLILPNGLTGQISLLVVLRSQFRFFTKIAGEDS